LAPIPLVLPRLRLLLACVLWMMQEELRAAGQQQQRPPPVLKFRAAGSKEWRHPCVLLPGLHLAAAAGKCGEGSAAAAAAAAADADVGVGEVHISKCCATTRILLLPSTGAAMAAVATAEADAAAVAAVAAEQPRPLRVEVRCRQLQVALWDDERQHLLPAANGYGSGGRRALGRELFSFTVDHLHLQLSRQLYLATAAAPAATGSHRSGDIARQLHPWQQQVLLVMAAQLTAAALQLDSFLPGGEQPVLLTTLPEDGIGSGGGHYRQRRGPPLQLSLEVHHCPPPLPASSISSGGNASSGEMSFRNSWVRDLLVQLPTLAVAADDSLLLFGDRLMGLMAGGGSAGSGSDGTTALAVAGSSAAAAAGQQQPQHQAALTLLQQSLAAEAAGAAASRLYTELAVVESGGCRCHRRCCPRAADVLALQCTASRTARSRLCGLPSLVPLCLQCACCWMLTSMPAPRGCQWRWTLTGHP
jgi:hypothetical protein